MWEYRARIVDVYDGDTLTAEIDLGFDLRRTIKVRLQGVYAPELREQGGVECKKFVEAWVNDVELKYFGIPWQFIVRTLRKQNNAGEVTTFDRYVATVSDLSGSKVLNEAVELYVTQNGFGGGVGV